MAGKIKNYYAGGNTARGFHSLYDSAFEGLDRLFILKGGPGTGKSTLIKKISSEMVGKGFNVELYHCSSDNDSLDGIIIPQLKVGIVDGTAPHIIEPKAPGAVDVYINLGEAWDEEHLTEYREEIERLSGEISDSFDKAYSTFAEALKIHDEWEKIYIENMDFAAADQVTEEVIGLFVGERKLAKASAVKHRFFGAATPKGAVDFIPNLTEDIEKRYFIKGRPGSGKSTLLKKLVKAAEERGFDVEVYHCGFDPHSLDMVIIPERSMAIFDSTAPHEYFPDRESDEIVDMYARTIKPGTDEKHASELERIVSRYEAKMKEATSYLAKAKHLHDELEKIYVPAMDFDKVEAIRQEIQAKIDKIADVAAVG